MVWLQRAARSAIAAGLALEVTLISGCGSHSSTGGSAAVGAANPGTVRILLADAPVAGVEAVNVTISKLEALYDGESDSRARVDDDHAVGETPDVEQDDNDMWQTLSTTPVTVNLLDYANKPADSLFNLVSASVPSGHYKKFRFTIAAVDLVISGSHITPMLGTNTVVVDAECFVSPRENERLVLDFDVGDSLQTGGTGFVFDPKLRLMQEDQSGSVSGAVQFQTTTPTNAFEAQVELVTDAGQVVAKSEVDIESLAPMTTGLVDFVIHAVPPGTYHVRATGDGSFQGVTNTPLLVQVGAGQSMQTEAVVLNR